ncbi:hypothetical protein D3C77_801040 [compost metagenome]
MISGTIIGESSRAVISRRIGMSARARPSAAQVPSTVANAVAKRPMMKLFLIARRQRGSLNTCSYQRSE